MKIPKHYSLIEEKPTHFIIHDKRDQTAFPVAKKGLDDAMKSNIAKIPHFDGGGPIDPTNPSGANSSSVSDTQDSVTPTQEQPEAPSPSIAGDAGSILRDSIGSTAAGLSEVAAPVWHGVRDFSRGLLGAPPLDASGNPTQPDPTAQAGQSAQQASVAQSSPQNIQAPRSPADVEQAQDNNPLSAKNTQGTGAQIVGGFDQFEKNINNSLNQMSTTGNNEAQAVQGYLTALQKQPTSDQIVAANAANEQKLMAAVASDKVDPNHYYKSMGTTNKVLTTIGLLFGGAPAAANLKSLVDRDIDAQKNSQDNDMNLYKMNQAALGNSLTAHAQTQNQMLAMIQGQIQAAAAKNYGPQAMLNAAPTLLEIAKMKQANNMLIGANHGAPGSENGYQNSINALRMVNPEYAKDLESKYVPGVGAASVPVTDADRKTMTSYSSLNNQISDAIHFMNTTGRTFPYSDADYRGDSIRKGIATELNNLHGLNRLSQVDLDLYMSQISNPGAWREGKAMGQLQELQKEVQNKFMSQSRALGIRPFSDSQPFSMAANQPQTQTMNGVQYQKVAGGWQRLR